MLGSKITLQHCVSRDFCEMGLFGRIRDIWAFCAVGKTGALLCLVYPIIL